MAFNGTITGRLGRDPELKYLESGQVVANFTVAVRTSRPQQDEARWVKVAVWGKPAEYVGNYVRKGDSVYLVGRVEAPEIFTDRNGEVRVAEKFTAENIENWQPRDHQGGAPARAAAPAAAPAPAPAPAPVYQPPAAAPAPAYAPAPAAAPAGGYDDPPF
jgi:single-strand DNA-binding protein